MGYKLLDLIAVFFCHFMQLEIGTKSMLAVNLDEEEEEEEEYYSQLQSRPFTFHLHKLKIIFTIPLIPFSPISQNKYVCGLPLIIISGPFLYWSTVGD